MLRQHSALYQPPTGYVLLSTPDHIADGQAWYQWDCLSKLALGSWFAGLRQYGITRLEYRGYESVPLPQMAARLAANVSPDTIVVLLLMDPPQDPNGPPLAQYGVDGGWLAYHTYLSGRGPYAIIPTAAVQPQFVTALVSHEMVEALMDSPPGAGWWSDQRDDEAADECPTILDASGYTVAGYWDNYAHGCYGSQQISFGALR